MVQFALNSDSVDSKFYFIMLKRLFRVLFTMEVAFGIKSQYEIIAVKNNLTGLDGTKKIIDLGDANFIMLFKPGVKHYNIEFSNTNGLDMKAILASTVI